MKASGSTWTGRSLRRVEDPALLTGRGRFTADLPAAFQVRFVRQSGRRRHDRESYRPRRRVVFTAADLEAVKPMVPSLNKFGYVLVEQRVPASGVVRYVGTRSRAVWRGARPLPKTSPKTSTREGSRCVVDALRRVCRSFPCSRACAPQPPVEAGRDAGVRRRPEWGTGALDARSALTRQNAMPLEGAPTCGVLIRVRGASR